MRLLPIFALALLSSPAAAEQYTGVMVNLYTGYVGPIIIIDGAEVRPEHIAACGAGCEFTTFLMPGQCMVVSVSLGEAYGYFFGPSDDIANAQTQAHRYCVREGGRNCQEYPPICG